MSGDMIIDYNPKPEWGRLKEKILKGDYKTYMEAYDLLKSFLDVFLDDVMFATGVLDVAEQLIHQGPNEYGQQDYLRELMGWVEWVVYKLWGVDIGGTEEMIDRVLGDQKQDNDGDDDYKQTLDYWYDLEAERGEEEIK